MKPLDGGEFGALVKDVFDDHSVRSALQIPIEGLRLLGKSSSSGTLLRMELDKKGGGKVRILRRVPHTTSVIDVVVWHVPLTMRIQFETVVDSVYLRRD